MDEALAQQARQRARHTCEYCLMAQADYPAPFQVDSVIYSRPVARPTNGASAVLYSRRHLSPAPAMR
jgi:hypothetical protein